MGACLLAAVLTAGCAATAARVTVLTSDATALSPGLTYAWAPPSAEVTDTRVARAVVEQRLHSAIDHALAARGYRRAAASERAALQVAYHAVLEDVQDTSINGRSLVGGRTCGVRGCRDGWGPYGPPTGNVNLAAYAKGTLILDVTDARTGRLAWRVTSDRRVDHAEATQAGLNSIVTEMTRTLPGL